MAVLFDTRAYHRTLTDAGVPSDQADAHMRALEAAFEGGLAIKQDVQLVKQDVQLVRQELALGLRDQKIWFGGALVVAVGVILGAGKLIWN